MKIVVKIGKIAFKVAIFTGLTWLLVPAGILYSCSYVLNTNGFLDQGLDYVSRNLEISIVGLVLIFLPFIILAFLTFIQNVTRIVTKDQSFSIYRKIFNKRRKKGIEAKFDNKTISLKKIKRLGV